MVLTAGLLAWYGNGMSHFRGIVASTKHLQSRGAIVEWYLRSWPQFDQVTRISLQGTQPTAEDLRVLGGLTDLAWLSLARTPVTDDDLARLATLESLQELDLSETAISDAGLMTLARLPHLATVKVGGTKVTPKGVATFVTERPGVNVVLEVTKAHEVKEPATTSY
jgi:hypothetical protein